MGTLIVTGNAAFTNNIQANTINGVEIGPNPKFTDTGTVTSVAVAAANNSGITVSGSPITSVGTITIGLNLSNAINRLGEGTNPANRNDYAVVQYAGGGTSTVTYHRRKLSNVFAALNSTDITNALGGNKNANVVFAGPSSGTAATPGFRALVSADLPAGTNSVAGAVKLGASGGAATYEHTHSASLASDNTSSGVVSLSHGGQYKLTAGGSSVIFKLPSISLTAADIPNLNADKITDGILPVARGGTGATSFAANSLIMSGTSTTAALTTRAISTSITTNNSTNIPTESAVKTYVDNQIATL